MKRLLLSLNNFLLISLSILIGLLLFSIMQNQQHNEYIINLNQRAPIIAENFEQLSPKTAKDFYYSVYSISKKKIIKSNIEGMEGPKIRFNYTVSDGNDDVMISIYEKELSYKKLSNFVCYFTFFSYITGFILLYIVDRKKLLVEQVEQLQSTDSLTHLFNKAKFIQLLDKRMKDNGEFYVVVTDIENFKRINQISGYEIGDLLLKNYALSLRLKKIIKNPARISGNQFVFYLNKEDIEEKNITEVLNNMVNEFYVIHDYTYNIKQNIGYVVYPNNAINADELIKFAEIAMHEAKESHQSIEPYQDIILEKISKNNSITRELTHALEKNELFIVFQPKVNLLTNIIHAEVLVRWKNAKLGFIPPDIFIDIAEKTGEIYKLGKWIFEQSIQEIAHYQKEGKIVNLSINLSPRQLNNKNLYNDFTQIIQKYNINPNQITLELTESVMLEKDNNFELLSKFSQDGIKISIDDFGKGYSSLSYLKDFPVNEIKLDKNFVDEIDKPFNAHLVESIANLSKKLNMSLVVEGVETVEQEKILTELGCYFFQGYYYSKPLIKDDFKNYVNKKLALL